MDDIFQEIDTPVVTIDEDKDFLAELVGEGKKFKTPQELARGKAESDRYIETLKGQIASLQNEVNTRTSLDGFKTMLEQIQTPAPTSVQPSVTPDEKPQLDEAQLESIVQTLLAKREAERAQESNSQMVTRVLEENFGPSTQLVINAKAKELGMSLASMKALASQSPQAFLQLVGATQGQQRPVHGGQVPQGTFRPADGPAPQGARGRSYYENLKRTNPTLYNDQKTTVQMMNDMAKLGRDKFNQS